MQSFVLVILSTIICSTAAYRNGWIGNIPLTPYYKDYKHHNYGYKPPDDCMISVPNSKAFRDRNNLACIQYFKNTKCGDREDCYLDKGEKCIPQNDHWRCHAGLFCNLNICEGDGKSLRSLDFLRSFRNLEPEEYDEFVK